MFYEYHYNYAPAVTYGSFRDSGAFPPKGFLASVPSPLRPSTPSRLILVG